MIHVNAKVKIFWFFPILRGEAGLPSPPVSPQKMKENQFFHESWHRRWREGKAFKKLDYRGQSSGYPNIQKIGITFKILNIFDILNASGGETNS